MQTVERFFQDYAQAYISGDLASFEQLVATPSLLLAGEQKTLLIDSDSLRQHVLTTVEKYRDLGVVNVDFVLQHQLRLSEQMQFSSLYWRFYAGNGKVLFTCHTSYTLQKCDTQWQVVSIIIDDEQAAYNRVAASQA
ncbi:hypothetical protein [Rheinheimera maricola]|uniref:Nuclear transport factor 2 family protein n=1 Tax=Rheinheimera maricola TaxID=2793282 RepID=A0ABS7XDF4_9GAMM|nr:hypothetical protein [Rheinheimera maricola]MBZ9613597.1 hypothetical protein [Rheinheimera maricola]